MARPVLLFDRVGGGALLAGGTVFVLLAASFHAGAFPALGDAVAERLGLGEQWLGYRAYYRLLPAPIVLFGAGLLFYARRAVSNAGPLAGAVVLAVVCLLAGLAFGFRGVGGLEWFDIRQHWMSEGSDRMAGGTGILVGSLVLLLVHAARGGAGAESVGLGLTSLGAVAFLVQEIPPNLDLLPAVAFGTGWSFLGWSLLASARTGSRADADTAGDQRVSGREGHRLLRAAIPVAIGSAGWLLIFRLVETYGFVAANPHFAGGAMGPLAFHVGPVVLGATAALIGRGVAAYFVLAIGMVLVYPLGWITDRFASATSIDSGYVLLALALAGAGYLTVSTGIVILEAIRRRTQRSIGAPGSPRRPARPRPPRSLGGAQQP